ncbi:MAG TPA: 50S ribosomal protein L11 methyltransferase [Candidatus Binataceae bacterium]|nr:50S ribosomal protein L11 methyltransferase [Candidatus Binataceae bacterium]
MFSVRLEPEPEDFERLVAELWERGTSGITEGHGYLIAFFEDEADAREFGEPESVPDVDWVRETEEAWPPIEVGDRFFIAAPWRMELTPPGRIRLEINPGLQCGTGQHPCTRLCLEAMERVIRPGDSVLDVGSGSGILSIAAKALGAGRVVACDIDPEAEKPVPFFVGSVDAVRSGAFDVVVANISEDVIGDMRADFERVARTAILSGFQDERGEWTCVVLAANPATPRTSTRE